MNLHYFTREEFDRTYTDPAGEVHVVNWLDKCSPNLIVRLDVLRHLWRAPIHISPVEGAIGRYCNGESQHCFLKWGEVRAVDIFPDDLQNRYDADRFIIEARDIGFTGIGLYANWLFNNAPRIGFHLDVREGRNPGDPATWGGVHNELGQQVYVSLNDAMEELA